MFQRVAIYGLYAVLISILKNSSSRPFTGILLGLCCATAPAAEFELPSPEIQFPALDPASVELGRLLFYDPILSGNQSVSCATCHHPRLGTSDGLSLGLGDGAIGLGPERRIDPDNPPEQRIPRNSPALFNLGARQFRSLFHDGRLELDANQPAGIRTPLDSEMVSGFNGVLSAQAMFPVLAADEMAGHYSENEVAEAVRQGRLTHRGGAWEIISARVATIPTYRSAFAQVLGQDRAIRFTDIANSIADFIAFEWRAVDSRFDSYLRGRGKLSQQAALGMELFYGKSRCADCHSGLLQTDHGFHAIAMPQLGPGKAARFETHRRDTGRFRVTGRVEDIYRFRTPSLRNVALTAPYGHSGAYSTLEQVVRHHLDPVTALRSYQREYAQLPELPGAADWRIMDDADEVMAIAAANQLTPQKLSDDEVEALIAFLQALTDPTSRDGRLGIPAEVPSGLSVVQ